MYEAYHGGGRPLVDSIVDHHSSHLLEGARFAGGGRLEGKGLNLVSRVCFECAL